ncbi:MAG: M15 family metallopeptidase [Bdellovibrionota bacterium]|nr:M15 family metallopeptidase [Bdellovibrionota bacterium]
MNKILTGKTTDHLIYDESTNRYFHKDIYEDFLKLKEKASSFNIDLYVTSSFRSFEDQLRIWNEKANGERKIFDDNGIQVDPKTLPERELLESILRWSAIPGASRHHWGTDLDIVDKNTWPEGYHIQLTPDEFNEGGPFYEFRKWFDSLLKNEDGLGFFRPYETDLGGVAPEMWHLSHKKVAYELYTKFTIEVFKTHLEENFERMAMCDLLYENIEYYYENYVVNINRPY